MFSFFARFGGSDTAFARIAQRFQEIVDRFIARRSRDEEEEPVMVDADPVEPDPVEITAPVVDDPFNVA